MKRFFALLLSLLFVLSPIFSVSAKDTASTVSSVSASIAAGEVEAGSKVELTTGSDNTDIWYTVDGSNPTNSKTAYLYNNESGIIISHNVTVKASARINGKISGKISEFKYICPKGYIDDDMLWPLVHSKYHAFLDETNKKVGKNSIKIIGTTGMRISTGEIPIDSNFDYKLSFWLKTERLGIDNAAKFSVFLSGSGNERHPYDPGVTGATVGNYGKSFFDIKHTQDWTYYEVDINNMLGEMSAVTLILENSSASGLVWLDDVRLIALPKAYYPITVETDGKVYGNIYNQSTNSDFVLDQGIKIFNKAKGIEGGKLHYNVVSEIEPEVTLQSGNIETSLVGGEEKLNKIVLDKIKKYGTFRINFTMTNQYDAVYDAGVVRFSRLIDNTILMENGGTYLGTCGAIADDNGGMIANYIGNSFMRFDYDWTEVEKEKGVYGINNPDHQYITAMVNNNIEPILIFNTHGWPEWADEQGWPRTESDLEHFLGYIEFLVKHYKGKVKYFEFYNELNDRHSSSPTEYPDAKEYTETLKKVYAVLKKANPDAVLLAGATSGIGIDWAKTMFENGAADYMDYYSFHPYVQEGSPESQNWLDSMNSLNVTIQEIIGKPFPLFITEVGYSTARTIAKGKSAYQQMTYSLRLYTMAKSFKNLEKLTSYQIASGKRIYDTENQYGMIAGGYAQPLAVARAAFNNMHNGFEYDSTVSFAPNLYAYRFVGEGKDMYVLWTDDLECYADIECSNKSIQIYDIFGNLVEAKYNKRKIKAEVGSKLIYITLDKGETINSVTLKEKSSLSKKEIERYEKYFSNNSSYGFYAVIATMSLVLIAAIVVFLILRKRKHNKFV